MQVSIACTDHNLKRGNGDHSKQNATSPNVVNQARAKFRTVAIIARSFGSFTPRHISLKERVIVFERVKELLMERVTAAQSAAHSGVTSLFPDGKIGASVTPVTCCSREPCPKCSTTLCGYVAAYRKSSASSKINFVECVLISMPRLTHASSMNAVRGFDSTSDRKTLLVTLQLTHSTNNTHLDYSILKQKTIKIDSIHVRLKMSQRSGLTM
ncbi:hypothetical protein F2P81_017364 [Scophthalmus maximus]|uniref:Uncharacterized protein n=1 Tax=Scophthalmus maximus TaxID=52904 RepID=A0A6A4S8F8_SCOMX|nr:hypothetical protein F2P81_017364 [Scophthalmus maximus]